MTSCTSRNIGTIYGDWLTTTNNGQGLSTTLQNLQDGLGNNSSVQIASNSINFNRTGGSTFLLDGVALTASAAALNAAGAGSCPPTATYILQTPNVLLANAQDLSSLDTGVLKSTTGTGVISIATNIIDTYGADNNLFAGSDAGNTTLTGIRNAIFGLNCGNDLTTGQQNCLFGFESGANITTGALNSSYGDNCLSELLVGDNNCSYGAFSSENVLLSGNSAFGVSALQLGSAASNSCAFGAFSGSLRATYTECVFLGYRSDAVNNNLTNSIAIGANSSIALSNSMNLGNGCKVGINNSSPVYTLDIATVGGISAIQLEDSATPSTPSGNNGVLYVSGGNLFFLNNSGTPVQLN